MKKKFSSFIVAAFVLLMCVFASACDANYKDLEFKIYYAFSEDSENWIDGTNGISLNYSVDGEEDDASLVFDEFGGTIYLKVQIKNVKAKHIDKITITTTSTEGLNFSSVMVKENQTFALPMVDNVTTSLKFFENNSGKTHKLPLIVSRKLESIEADASIKPAMPLTVGADFGTLPLLSLNNIKYFPLNKTNQIGVKYSVASIGKYIENPETQQNEYVAFASLTESQEYATVENGVLKIINGNFFSADAYVIRVKATSIYYDGSVPGVDAIETTFDVYVIDSLEKISVPTVKFDSLSGEELQQEIHLYENGESFATSTVVVDTANLTSSNLVYKAPILTNNGAVTYTTVFYILNENGKYVKCDFENQDLEENPELEGTVGINGLYIKKGENDTYTFSVASREVLTNYVKVCYELEGLSYSKSQEGGEFKEIVVHKDIIPTNIIVNDSLTMKDADTETANVYSVNNASYKGLKLKFVANPNNNLERKIEFGHNSNVIVYNENGEPVSWVYSGSTVYVKLASGASTGQLDITTLVTPSIYNEQEVVGKDYITIRYNLNKLVTADSFTFVASEKGAALVGNALVNASKDDYMYVRVEYSGDSLVTSTVNLQSLSENVKFENGTDKMSLSEAVCTFTGLTATGKFDIYRIPIKAIGSKETAQISITAGDESFTITETGTLSSVFVVESENETLNVDTLTQGVKEFTTAEVDNNAFNFAISRGESAQFTVKDGAGKTNTISSINISIKDVEGTNFSKELFNPMVISSSVFEVVSYQSGKTQVLDISVSYYVLDEDPLSVTYTQIVSKTEVVTVQIAIYDSVGIITKTLSNEQIGFINSFYNEVSSTEISFKSYTYGNGSPTSSVVFTGFDAGSTIEIGGASQIMVKFDNYYALTNSRVVESYYMADGKKVSLLDTNEGKIILDNKGTASTNDDVSFLDHSFVVELKNKTTNIKSISLTLTALRFGVFSNTSINININIAEVDKAERIIVDGKDFVQTNSESKELQMSFIDVANGGYDSAEFEAGLEFATPTVPNGMLRFDKIQNALTYILYRYALDENGNPKLDENGNAIYSRINNDFFDVILQDGVVTINSYKNRGGGLFKLVLATKDSYNLNVDPSTVVLDETHFDNTYELTVRVSDGTKAAAYIINNTEDLELINFNLDKHFVLGANLGYDNEVNIQPLGVVEEYDRTVVKPFTGSLSGQFTTVVQGNQDKTSTYSIKIKINGTVMTTENGYLAGLFAILGENAEVSNLNLEVTFGETFTSTDTNGLKIGAIAAINNGKLDNVHITLEESSTIGFASSGVINFGGMVGVNNGEIKASTFESYASLNVVSNEYQRHNIGLIAGLNDTTGSISGAYLGKTSLNNFTYDVIANLNITNTNETNDGNFVKYYAGGVAGTNNGEIYNMLIGGSINMSTRNNLNMQSGALGGVAGATEGGDIYNLATLSLDIISTSSSVNVAGVVGEFKNSDITNVKVISATSSINAEDILGIISGKELVGGIVANAYGGTITHASVESFIDEIDRSGIISTFFTLQTGSTVGGLVANAEGTTIEKSFVNANISSTGDIYLTSNISSTDTYFIGKVDGTVTAAITTYNIVNGKLNGEDIVLANYAVDISSDVNSETANWKNIYIDNLDGTYTPATEYIEGGKYIKFNMSSVVADIATNSAWDCNDNYNIVKVGEVELFFPYLVDEESNPIMIVKPQSISANINEDYKTSVDAVYVEKFDYLEYVNIIKESVVVNFLKGATDEDNAYYIFNDGSNNGLLDITLLPTDAQGGYGFEIIGDGHNFAYINLKKQLVFTRESGNTPVIVRVYSVFNTEIESYVAIYSQSLQTRLTLNSSSIYFANEIDYEYEINLYTGQNNKVIAFGAENIVNGESYNTLFDVETLTQHLIVETELDVDSKLLVNATNFKSMTLRIDENANVLSDDAEIIKFTLFLKPTYFGNYTYEGSPYNYVQENVKIGEVRLKANLYNAAENIDVDGSDAEITTHDDISFTATLTTEYVDEEAYETNPTKVENVLVNAEGELYLDVENQDGIRIKFEILEGNEEVQKLCEANNATHFADLLVGNAQILSSLHTAENEGTVLGYKYDIFLQLPDEHKARFINNDIKINIIVYALSNPDVNTEDYPLEITLKPTALKTLRMENYVVKSLNMFTDYSNIVTNKDVETSIIEPGGLGNVMMIYLEPSYAHVETVKIQTSKLYVPSLNRNIQVKFTQLALDMRAGAKGEFATLSGSSANTQVGDTLELRTISQIDKFGVEHYTGIICVLIQIEEPFVGLEASLTISLTATTETNPEGITVTRDLLTSYLPGAEITYDNEKAVEDGSGYLVQKGTSNNEVTLKIYGYQFNSNPTIEYAWELPEGSTFTYDPNNKGSITDGTNTYLIGDYVTCYPVKDVNDVVYDSLRDSYTLKLKLNVAEDIPASFRISATLYLITKDGQLKTSAGEENSLVFYPTEYILNSVQIAGLSENNRKNIPINQTRDLQLFFTTDNSVYDLTDKIYSDLLTYANSISEDKLASLFSYYKNAPYTFADKKTEFEYNLVDDKITITGLEQFSQLVKFQFNYKYIADENGVYKIEFGTESKTISTTFTLNVFATNAEDEIIIYTAEDIYDSQSQTWNLVEGGHYVLVNDITLENVKPITTKIASFDGNNRVISIKSFSVDTETNEYGLFGSVGKYTVEDQESEQQIEHQTILKNMIVDYSKFEGTLAVNNITSNELVFGGLIAKNDGGLIYNCDVMNLSTTVQEIDIIVASNASITFGGLVGVNSGIITNSRVGRDSYTKITATKTTESTNTKKAEGLTFRVFNKQSGEDKVNQFAVTAGGFVGENGGTIASSYLTKTNLQNYSTNETTNITAGFAGRNTGSISYSFTKADDSTLSVKNAYSTGYTIEQLGNGNVAGFVYTNSGNIDNSYANLELKTKAAYIAGFVYENNGTITESYAATTMNSGLSSFAEQPFVGVDSNGDLLSNGTLENTYYLMRSSTDEPYTDEDKDVAHALNEENFQNGEYLVGFAFVLSNSKAEREQGIWSYYSIDNKKLILPELMNANTISHSYRFVEDNEAQEKVLRNAASYSKGSANNPYTISSVEEFNNVFTEYGNNKNPVINVRFINDINFNDDETAIQTRFNYKLGSSQSSSKTSVEGNGMTISGIYLDVGDAVVDKIGLFAEIDNAYVKNLNLKFATPKTDGQFSTTTAMYSGGLAGKIENSAVINITLDGANTTLTGSNFVGGVAGMISGSSLVYGIETNLNVKANATENYLYYSKEDYEDLKINQMSYENYLKRLSYAGGVAGVMDLTKRSNIDYNVQFIDVRGDEMSAKTFDGKPEANILAEYAGGVAGFASEKTQSLKLRYFMGQNEVIQGDSAVGGLFAVGMGSIVASQVASEEEVQFTHDTTFGDYVISLANDEANSTLDKTQTGNLTLLEGNNYVGGLVGLGLNTRINACYSKASVNSGAVIGGLIGASVGGIINYSYAIPYVNYTENSLVGGLIGSAYAIQPVTPTRNENIKVYELLLKNHDVVEQVTDIQFTYSTILIDDDVEYENATLDYICADYSGDGKKYLQSNQSSSLLYVYAGPVNYKNNTVSNETKLSNKSSVVDLFRLYNVGDPDQTVAFQEVFSGWALIKYWSLNDEKYFPLLNNETVDNYIIIDHENDLDYIRTNPNGKFKVTKDFTISEEDSNWVISGEFTGVLVGEIENDDRKPVITIQGLQPQTTDASSGFFERTHNATLSNLTFVWVSAEDNPSIDMSGVDHLTMVSGLTCNDENSLITNVEVRVSGYKTNPDDKFYNGYLLYEENIEKTIGGFAGLVGKAKNTNILGCSYYGQVKANVKNSISEDVYVGGAVGYAETYSESGDSTVVNDVKIGASKSNQTSSVGLPKTTFELNILGNTNHDVYIGGAVGKGVNIAIASNEVASVTYEECYKQVEINLTLNNFEKNLYLGGLIGFAENGGISNCEASTKIDVGGTCSSPMLKVGGMGGEYSQSAPSSTGGISKCNSYSEITLTVTSNETHTMLSTGVAMLDGSATMKQCLITGEINSTSSELPVIYAGGAVANVMSSTNYYVDLEEITTNSVLRVGSAGTSVLYAGGLVASANKIQISYSSSLGRIVPTTTSEEDNDVYVGGLIGEINETAFVNNSYTLSSIIASNLGINKIQGAKLGALVGSIPENSTVEEIGFENVYYSTDYALTTEENKVEDNKLGTNLLATTMTRSAAWHKDLKTEDNETNEIWKSTFNALPYLTSLEETMVEYGVLTSTYQYVSGSAMNPMSVNGGFKDEYTYYLKEDGDTIVPNNKALNGILISTNDEVLVNTLNDYEDGVRYSGLIPAIRSESAVSNLHVKLNQDIEKANLFGVIAGLNNGVIFNCSVQGNGISLSGSEAGVISGSNLGLISYSYSSIEIISATHAIGGIAHTNEGKLWSNYFTGYIGATGAGITVNNTGFIYNNYMSGVVTGITINGTAFAGKQLTEEEALNNFIDYYSDIQFGKLENDKETVLRAVRTADLMANFDAENNQPLLAGEWNVCVTNGEFDTTSTRFGYNYNYPIFNFNKLKSNDGVSLFEVDFKVGQLYTGTGLMDTTEDTNGGEFTLIDRFSVLVYNDGVNYNDAFKIPHLGVLTSVQNLLNENRNYVLLYDLIGQDVEWTAIGTDTTELINGEPVDETLNGFKFVNGFKGVFVTNKYYSHSVGEENYCVVENFSNNGLFDNVNNAYIANIKFGNFTNLENSGALGKSVENDVTIDNIYFKDGVKITAKTENLESITNYYGGLFGEVCGNLVVKKFISPEVSANYLTLEGAENTIAGLIAGKLTGAISLIDCDTNGLNQENDSKYCVKFSGNNVAGGVVGEIDGGSVDGEENTINIATVENKSTNILGGVAGLASTTESRFNISNIEVMLPNNIIRANSFGGVVGGATNTELNEDLLSTIRNFTISGSVRINGSGTVRYYGLLIGQLESICLAAEEIKINVNEEISVEGVEAEDENYNETSDSTAIGTFVGVFKTSKISVKYELNKELVYNVIGVPNVGGFMGYVVTDISSSISFEGNAQDYPINITGSTNVGGLFGRLDGDLAENAITGDDLLKATQAYAKIIISGSKVESIKYTNFGGLIGLWNGNNESKLENRNTIETGLEGTAYNIGGVAGKFVTGEIKNLSNNASITSNNLIKNSETEEVEVITNYLETDREKEVTKLVNVGGVLGVCITTDGAVISNVSSTGDISGYQNVGGIVGYAKNTTILGTITTDLSKIKYDLSSKKLYKDGNENNTIDEGEELNDLTTLPAEVLNATKVSGSLVGVINVGGVVGYAEEVDVQNIFANVCAYGNANVGGVVGFANTSSVTASGLINAAAEGDEETGVVKGVYYQHLTIENREETIKNYIPASVGGLIGTSVKTELKNNILYGTKVTSTLEGLEVDGVAGEFDTISTISNYMADIAVGDSNKNKYELFAKYDKIYNLADKDKLNFANINSGYGGMIGTVDTETILQSTVENQPNYLLNIDVQAQLGVNVGTFYGAYKVTSSIEEDGQHVAFNTPILYSTEGGVNVDGAYNVGGLVGYIDGGSGAFNITNKTILGNDVTINLQSRQVGIYVGGLFGKTNANVISDLGYDNNAAVKIKMHTDNCYYAGGLIGRANITSDAAIKGNLGDENLENYQIVADGQDDRFNFGALIGILKVAQSLGDGYNITVEGDHKYPFTISTIENSNYYDGDSRFNSERNDTGVALYAEAYYVNKDSFNISGSKDETLYDAVDDRNPLNDKAIGWSKEYTGFKQLQRNIPQSDNNGAEWDSIAVLFDATSITHVGTIENLGLWDDNDGDGVNDKSLMTKKGNEYLDKGHVCFTVYEQYDGQATLYSAMGIASIVNNYDEGKPNQIYRTLENLDAEWNDYVLSFFTEESPFRLLYIDAYDNSENHNSMKALSYFQWGVDDYSTLGSGTTKYQNTADGEDDLSGDLVFVSYFIPNYLGANSTTGAQHDSESGAYFVFDVVYKNTSAVDLSYDKEKTVSSGSNSTLPASGSMFDVSGIYDTEIHAYVMNEENVDGAGIAIKAIKFVISVVIAFVTWGTSVIAQQGIKATAKMALKAVAKLFTKKALKKAAKYAARAFLVYLVVATAYKVFFADVVNSYKHFSEPTNLNFGFISSTYSRNISYERNDDGKFVLSAETDYKFVDDYGNPYYYYSSTRPNDYNQDIKIGLEITAKISGTNNTPTQIPATIEEWVVDIPSVEDAEFVVVENIKYSGLVNVLDGGTTSLNEVAIDEDGRVYSIANKYKYVNGQYYIYAYYSDIENSQITLGFTPQTYSDALGTIMEYETPNFIEVGNKYYVHGSFAGETYIYNNVYTDNLLQYNSGTYTINGTTIANDVAEHNQTALNYKPAEDIDIYPQDILGYDYFTKVYYTANGTSGLKDNEGADLVKYANFEYVRDVDGLNYVEDSLGTKGVDYIVKDYSYSGYVQNNNGTHVCVNGNYYELSANLDKIYNKAGDSAPAQNDGIYNGKYFKVGSTYTEITSSIRYTKNPTKFGLFKFVGENTSVTSATVFSSSKSFSAGEEIVVAVYPSAFVNPYTEDSSSVSGDDCCWKYTEKTDNILSFAPKYFIYEGGYMADVVKGDGEQIKGGMIYTPIEADLLESYKISIQEWNDSNKDNIADDGELTGEAEIKSFKDILEGWNTYKNYYIISMDASVEETFKVNNNVLYKINEMYTLSEDGLLSSINVQPIGMTEDIFKNLYLSNSDYKLYTRYKYETDLTNSISWGINNVEIVPTGDKTMINHGIPTRLVESCRVILSGGTNLKIQDNDSPSSVGNSGTISIN